MNLTIVHQPLTFPTVSLVTPTESYYIHLAAEVDQSPVPFFLSKSSKKKELLQNAKTWCNQIKAQAGVVSVVIFTALLIPPGRGKFIEQRKEEVPIAKFDVVVLIEAANRSVIDGVKESAAYQQLERAIKKTARHTHIVTATNVKRIGPVDHKRQGVFLFNYYVADSTEQNLGVWEYTAGWFQRETGLNNSTVLLPIQSEKSDYSIINHCRWDKMSDILPALLFKQSFHAYVLDNFYANKVAAMPILYKMME